ncbi:MAG: hypothetical protein AAFU60_14600, partial [Bacteroidota bacterium]
GVCSLQAQNHRFELSLDLYGQLLKTTSDNEFERLRFGQSLGLSLGRSVGPRSFLTIGSMLSNGGTRFVSETTCLANILDPGSPPEHILQTLDYRAIRRDYSIEGFLAYRYQWGQGPHAWYASGRGIIRYVMLEQLVERSECGTAWANESSSWSRFDILEMELGLGIGIGRIWNLGPNWALQTEWRNQLFWQAGDPSWIRASGLEASITRKW